MPLVTWAGAVKCAQQEVGHEVLHSGGLLPLLPLALPCPQHIPKMGEPIRMHIIIMQPRDFRRSFAYANWVDLARALYMYMYMYIHHMTSHNLFTI